MKISILSDTHSYLDDQIIRLLIDSDEIWHAGDIGNIDVYDQLAQLPGKLRAVHGNIDDKQTQGIAPKFAYIEIDSCKVVMTHIAGTPPRYNKEVLKYVRQIRPRMLVCGHSHILRIENDKKNNVLFVNPGACGHHGFHKVRTMVQFELINSMPTNMNVIELGRRGKLNPEAG